VRRSRTCIIDSEVFDKQGNNLALSKDDFATAVLGRHNPFDNLDFSAFSIVFEVIKEILQSRKERRP
jgi:hypothetical protein